MPLEAPVTTSEGGTAAIFFRLRSVIPSLLPTSLSRDQQDRLKVIASALCTFGNFQGIPRSFLASALTAYSSCGAEASSFDVVSAALPLEAVEVAASRHSRSCSHSRRRIRRPALAFGRAVVVQHFPCRRHKTSPN